MQAALEEYQSRIINLKSYLSHDNEYISPSSDFSKSLDKDTSELESVAFKKQSDLFTTEPYRKKLHFISYRLQSNLKAINNRLADKPTKTPQAAYHHVSDFLQDLYLIRDSLISHNDVDIANRDLEVMFLARLAGLVGLNDKDEFFCNIQISPLFETIEDLKHIKEVLTNLFKNPIYKALLTASGNLQEVMLGYSDSCKGIRYGHYWFIKS